jgi:hypothetical protein
MSPIKNAVPLRTCSYRGKKGSFYVNNYHLKTRTTNNANGQGAECLPARIVERKVLFQTLAGKRVKYPNGYQKQSHSKSPQKLP